ncbi:MAG: hypothetical protein AB7T10_00345 [bacterium]
MKRASLVIFIISVTAVLIAWSLLNRSLINKAMTIHAPEIGGNVKTLIMGDSHAQTALDPSLMKDAISLTYSNENYFFTYYKLKWALERGRNIENVIIGFSIHNLTDAQERVIKERTFFLEHGFLLLDDYGKNIVKKKSSDLYNYFKLKYEFGAPMNFYNNDLLLINFASDKEEFREKIWGGYKKMSSANMTEEQKQKLIKEKNTKDYISSPLMTEYLLKIVSLCEERKISLYLLNTPIHKLYFERYTEETVITFFKDIEFLKENVDFRYLDYQWFMQDDSFFYDGEHLNERGAEIFSRIIDSIVSGGEKSAI